MIFATRIAFLFGSASADRAFAVDYIVGAALIFGAVILGYIARDAVRGRRRRARRVGPVKCNWEKSE